jgi:hypothetical protein
MPTAPEESLDPSHVFQKEWKGSEKLQESGSFGLDVAASERCNRRKRRAMNEHKHSDQRGSLPGTSAREYGNYPIQLGEFEEQL